MPEGLPLLMDRAYEGNETRQLVMDLGMIPVVPPKSNRLHPWEYDRALYKKRNEVERLFRRLKGFRRIFSRFEKLDVIFLAFLCFAFIVEALRVSVNTPCPQGRGRGHVGQRARTHHVLAGTLEKSRLFFAVR